MQPTIRLLAPAKINLALHVVGRRPDGYHDLETLAVFADIGDEIEIGPADSDLFSGSGASFSDALSGNDNLCVRARDALRSAFPGHHAPPVHIRLTKNLPVAAGIGGGSSDAAATFRGLSQHWAMPVENDRLRAIASVLGADLPMCVHAKPLVARGTGERIEPAPAIPALDMVLVNPRRGVETPAVFRNLSSRENPPLPSLPATVSFNALVDWLRQTRNDLQQAALAIEPAIADCIAALEACGAAFSRMSGSGATCFGLFENRREAELARDRMMREAPGWFVSVTRTGASEA